MITASALYPVILVISPLSFLCCAPHKKEKGPTAIPRSLSKIDQTRTSNGCAVNIKLNPSMLARPQGRQNLAHLVERYFNSGGIEVQFNVVDNATLRDAQAHPGKYPDLTVRVSGYSATFTDLGRAIQDEIISRTTFEGH